MSEAKTTPLHGMHVSRGAKMVPFAGYDMPLNYPPGIIREHQHTRSAAGMFDVSHMGQIEIRPLTGDMDAAAAALERLTPADIVGLAAGRQRYALLTDDGGGILDDAMVLRREDHFVAVVNAARREADLAYLTSALDGVCAVAMLDRGLIALQGPKAEAVLMRMHPDLAMMRFMDVKDIDFQSVHTVVTRSGYTGEDGFEISVRLQETHDFADRLLAAPDVMPVGLGARDTLRLEAGLCLHGHDIDTGTSPVEAALDWAVGAARRPGGARAGGYPGAGRIGAELTTGAARRRVGLVPEGRAPLREGAEILADEDGAPVGTVTSGGFGPSVDGPIAMGYVPTDRAAPETQLFARLRDRIVPVKVTALPFVQPRYKRA